MEKRLKAKYLRGLLYGGSTASIFRKVD